MNYFAHGLLHIDRPYFLAGTCAPDWLSAIDRGVRLRTRSAAPHVEDDDPCVGEFARGVLQHLSDDDWFHGSRGFAEVTGELAAAFRTSIGADHPTPCSFLGHIVTEMLLDAELIRRFPETLDAYYRALEGIDPERIERAVNQCAARGRTDRLQEFIPLFLRERFLADYVQPGGLWMRLNQVLLRVRLTPLPESGRGALTEGRRLVAARFEDLLPRERFAPPAETPARDG
ncbi:MAG: hypothetical protein KF774_09645 [Planctomyces sp.]|nr:hypothetical protein [Planctomyces sp.]